jgi:hypothetical protein
MRSLVRSSAALAVVWLLVVAFAPPSAAAVVLPAEPYDFNGDGYADLAVGVPGEAVGSKRAAGAVTVIPGSRTGLRATGAQKWTQDSAGVPGVAEGCARRDCEDDGDLFGIALASADFDRDGYADLAIGAGFDRVGEVDDAGAVNVLYGSRRGLISAGAQRWTQALLPGAPEAGDRFGTGLAAGDLDGDGFSDLAIAIPWDGINGVARAGAVQVLRGSGDGLTATGGRRFGRSVTGMPDVEYEAFGTSLAIGRLDSDRYGDLVVGTPDYHCNSSDCVTSGGEVAVLYGGASMVPHARVERWTQDSPDVVDAAEPDDFFGASLALADFDADGHMDIAVGAPREKVTECGQWCLGQGAVTVLYGTASGPSGARSQLWHLDVPGIPGVAQPGTYAGSSLAAGDLDGDGADELVLGSSMSTVGGHEAAGAVVVVQGTPGVGLASAGAARWTQATSGVPGAAATGDRFGFSITVRDVGRSARGDLLIGAPGDTADGARGGSVTVLYGSKAGPTTSGTQRWSQGSAGIPGAAESGDSLGQSLGR